MNTPPLATRFARRSIAQLESRDYGRSTSNPLTDPPSGAKQRLNLQRPSNRPSIANATHARDLVDAVSFTTSQKRLAGFASSRKLLDFTTEEGVSIEMKAAYYLAGGIRGRKVHSINRKNLKAYSLYFSSTWRRIVKVCSILHIMLTFWENPRAKKSINRIVFDGDREVLISLLLISVQFIDIFLR